MKKSDKAKELELRTRKFSFQIIKLSTKLEHTFESQIIRKQLVRSATSIGANYHEANRPKSNADFKYKIKICEGETNETIYWLRLIEDQGWADNNCLRPLIQECSELLSIFTSISYTLSLKEKQIRQSK